MKLILSVISVSAILLIPAEAFADSGDMSLTRSEVQGQLTQAYLHDTRAVDEPNTYPNPSRDRRYVAKTRQKASGMSPTNSY
jgi:hypothetical protein